MGKKQLRTYVSKNTKSVELMDEFESVDEDGKPYEQMLINDLRWGTATDGSRFYYRLIVERVKPGEETEGDITFTEFKKGETLELREYVDSQITEKVVSEFSGKDKIFYFKKPFHLRAQNSSNRCGYGWEWDWSGGYGSYIEGTQYGETSDYGFTGVYIA